jgi:hypothetical protein
MASAIQPVYLLFPFKLLKISMPAVFMPRNIRCQKSFALTNPEDELNLST